MGIYICCSFSCINSLGARSMTHNEFEYKKIVDL